MHFELCVRAPCVRALFVFVVTLIRDGVDREVVGVVRMCVYGRGVLRRAKGKANPEFPVNMFVTH